MRKSRDNSTGKAVKATMSSCAKEMDSDNLSKRILRKRKPKEELSVANMKSKITRGKSNNDNDDDLGNERIKMEKSCMRVKTRASIDVDEGKSKNKSTSTQKDVDKGDEEPSNFPKKPEFEVTLPPMGPNASNQCAARNRVKETLRLFHSICRKLLQEEEAKSSDNSGNTRRFDLVAAEVIKEKKKEVNTECRFVGSVPGVEVGIEFQYRVELVLVGVHHLYQAGIAYTKKDDGKIIATSIVASGGYADCLDNPDILIYSGQGGFLHGSKKAPEDQKLERGNLALFNSISEKNAVRVIHGTKETKPKVKSQNVKARAKITTTYTYDGLYLVEKYWQEVGHYDKLVYKFELRRIPGQPNIAWKEAKKIKKFKVREGICDDDISKGMELFPFCAVNTVDNEKPPSFTYITKMRYPDSYNPVPRNGCDCIDGCVDSRKCFCVVKNGGEIPFNYNGAIVEAKSVVYECGPSCKCPPSCHNRVSQHGTKIQLEIFKTESRGWGVRSLNSISSGSFVSEYMGELIEDKEAEKRKNDEYLFDIGEKYGVGGYTIDAAEFGNVGRFINHSCSPNLYAQNVVYDNEEERKPHIMFFAAENIPPLQELSYDYNYAVDSVLDSNGNIKKKNCYCGSVDCTGRMY